MKPEKIYVLKATQKFFDSKAKVMRNKGEKPFQTTEERGKAILKTGFATLVSIIHPQHIEEVKKSFEYKPKKKRIRKSRKVSA